MECDTQYNRGKEQNSKFVRALSVPRHVGLFDGPFVPLKLISKSWEPCSFKNVPDCP